MSGPVVLILRLLLSISLYCFLGFAVFSLWWEVRQQGLLLTERKTPPITLTISYAGSTPIMRYFNKPEVTIGRDPACECQVNDEAISFRHARLSFHHSQWWLEDLDSRNGTVLNQEKLVMPTVVIDDDKFSCGGTEFSISFTKIN